MSEMPENAKKSEHILSEVRRVLEENGVLDARSPIAVLQSQFDAAIAQRDELLEKVAHCESQMVHMRQVIMSKNTVDDKEDCKAEEKESAKPGTLEFLLEVSTALAQDTLRSNAALSSILGIKKTRPSSHQSAIDDICHFIRANRDRFWDEHGECEPHFLPPLGYVKQIGLGTFFLFTSGAFLEATRCGSRVSTAKVLDKYGLLRRHESDRHTSQHRISCLMAYGRFYAVNAKIFEFESKLP